MGGLLLFVCVAAAQAQEQLVPLCPTHNPMEWHALYDPTRNCHYNHEHKDNPGLFYAGMSAEERTTATKVNQLFGTPGAWFGGTSLSYPWQTFMGAGADYPPPSANTENMMKHAGYGWIVRVDIPQPAYNKQWIKDYRVQYHAIFGAAGAVTRFHSFSLEANLCQSVSNCRIVRTGGWLDFGNLIVNRQPIWLPGQEGDGQRRRIHASINVYEDAWVDSINPSAFWYGSLTRMDRVEEGWKWEGEAPFKLLQVVLESQDVWGPIDQRDPAALTFYCPDFSCRQNGSTVKMHRLQMATALNAFDGYTDRYGVVNHDCKAVGLDCIPTFIQSGDVLLYGMTTDGGRPLREYDTSPKGFWWIEYPN
jgi:hypothetical protein